MRFILIDSVTSLEKGVSIEGTKAWSLSEDFFADHFPGMPIVPGTMITESMGQILGLLIEKSYEERYPDAKGVYPILSIIRKAKFRKNVLAGSTMTLSAELTSLHKETANGVVQARVNGELMATSELSFFLVDKSAVTSKKLHEERESLVDYWMNGLPIDRSKRYGE